MEAKQASQVVRDPSGTEQPGEGSVQWGALHCGEDWLYEVFPIVTGCIGRREEVAVAARFAPEYPPQTTLSDET